MILGDYHTHTLNSDGRGTLEDTLRSAQEKGLQEVGISDHGLRHVFRGMKYRDIARMRTEMDKLKDKYNVRCLLSIEANICTSDGRIDLTEQQRDLFDYIVAGYHKAPLPYSFREAFAYNIPSLFVNFGRFTDAQRRKYTKAIVGAITSNRVNIISHLNYGIPCFVKEVAKAAVDYDVLIELNGKHVDMTDEEMMTLYDMGVSFVANSDAHSPSRIGDVARQIEVVDRLGWDKSRIVNWDKLPILKLK